MDEQVKRRTPGFVSEYASIFNPSSSKSSPSCFVKRAPIREAVAHALELCPSPPNPARPDAPEGSP